MIDIQKQLQIAYEKWDTKDFVFEKQASEYKGIKYGTFIAKSCTLARKLVDDGLSGKTIMIFAPNSTDYMIVDLAITAYVGICANVNPHLSAESVELIIQKADVAAVFYEDEVSDVFNELMEKHSEVKFYPLHATISRIKVDEDVFVNLPEKNQETCSKIVFTSGTTSDPKGVMLSLKNIFAGWDSFQKRANVDDSTIVYLFLPLTHTYANIYNFLYSFMFGPTLYLCSDTNKIGEELLEVRPTVMCGVPIIFRRLYEAYGENIAKAFGDRIKYLYTGGTILDRTLRRFYKEHGLMILEAYAMTETASSFSVEYPNFDDMESMGVPYEDMDIRIINQDANGIGDIVAKGDCVFLGYLKDPAKTREAFTDDGYFITGDYGYIKDGKLYVLGRKQDVLIGENGENVYLADIQAELMKLCGEIAKLTGEVRNGGIFYTIYVIDGGESKIPEIVEKYNATAVKHNLITDYEVKSASSIKFK